MNSRSGAAPTPTPLTAPKPTPAEILDRKADDSSASESWEPGQKVLIYSKFIEQWVSGTICSVYPDDEDMISVVYSYDGEETRERVHKCNIEPYTSTAL